MEITVKHLVLSSLVALFSCATFAAEFSPTYLETTDFRIKNSRGFPNHQQPRLCKFETRFNERKNVIELRIGVVGSPVDYFGWNMPLKKEEFPLKKGFTKYYSAPGTTVMIVYYDGKTLSFKRNKNDSVFTRLYPFSIEVDSHLLRPGKFKGTMEGFEANSFGQLKKHIVQNCRF